MTAREWWEVKWIQWIAVQENWSTVVSVADTVNIVWGWTVTDVWGVATINIPYWAEWYREDVPAGSATYTFVNEPATSTSFLIFTDSGTLLFSGIDYTYDASTHTVTFLSLDTNEAAYIWVAHANIVWGNVWDMVKAVYDPNNVQKNVYDYNYFINTPVVNTRMFKLSSTSDLQTAQEILDRVLSGKDAIVYHTYISGWAGDRELCYIYCWSNGSSIIFRSVENWFNTGERYSYSWTERPFLRLDYSNWTITNIVDGVLSSSWHFLDTGVDYSTPYSPQHDGSPTTKKYVDDSIADKVEWPASSVDWNIAVFDWATWKIIKDSWFNIQYTETHPTWDNVEVYYDNGTIYLYKPPVSVILTESWNTLTTENNDPLILEN